MPQFYGWQMWRREKSGEDNAKQIIEMIDQSLNSFIEEIFTKYCVSGHIHSIGHSWEWYKDGKTPFMFSRTLKIISIMQYSRTLESLGSLVQRLLDPTPILSDSIGMGSGGGANICISEMFLEDVDATGPGTTLCEPPL